MGQTGLDSMVITSPAFVPEGNIPPKYTCDGEAIHPELQLDHIPQGTQTLVVIAEDPDAPDGTYTHWVEWNIPPENPISEDRHAGIGGRNTSGKTGYHPPCPPDGSHRYYFHVYALDATLQLEAGAERAALEKAMEEHVIAKGTLMGRYGRSGNKAEQ